MLHLGKTAIKGIWGLIGPTNEKYFTDRKRSLGQGNVLTRVCLSTGGKGDLCLRMHHKSHDQGGFCPECAVLVN